MRSAEFAIHLFAEDVLQSIHSLFDCRVEAQSAELVAQMLNPTFCDPFDC
jgi:hypothetical protein